MSQPKRVGSFMLMPLNDPTVCQDCGEDHGPHEPHNYQNLYYQYNFYAEHDRWPTWHDAMRHCPQEVKDVVLEVLRKNKVDIGEDPGECHGKQ